MFLDVNALAVNVIIIWIQTVKEHKFSDVIALAVNVIIIWLLDSAKVIQDEGTHVFGCKPTSCKRYYNLDFRQ